MVAMDDFLTFKKLMVKRNVELGYEALQELQKELVPILAPATEQEAEIQFQRAVKESEDEAFEPMSRPGLEVVESREEKDQGYVVGPGGDGASLGSPPPTSAPVDGTCVGVLSRGPRASRGTGQRAPALRRRRRYGR